MKNALIIAGIIAVAGLLIYGCRNGWFKSNGSNERANKCLGACIDAQTQMGNPDPEGWCKDPNNSGTPPKCNFGGAGSAI